MNNKYWWVNHKKTLKQEISGGYIWSPKKNKNNARNKTYENLASVFPLQYLIMFEQMKKGN